MTSDITVDNKTGTLSIFIAETLADGNFSCFYYLGVATATLPIPGREYPIGWDGRAAASGERNLLCSRRKDRVVNPGRRAKRFEGTLAGVEKAGVAHDLADLLRRSDNLRIASGGPQDAEDSGVEDGRDLGQSGGDRDFADAQNELAQRRS